MKEPRCLITVECRSCRGKQTPCTLSFVACGSGYMKDLVECPFKNHRYRGLPNWEFLKEEKIYEQH